MTKHRKPAPSKIEPGMTSPPVSPRISPFLESELAELEAVIGVSADETGLHSPGPEGSKAHRKRRRQP